MDAVYVGKCVCVIGNGPVSDYIISNLKFKEKDSHTFIELYRFTSVKEFFSSVKNPNVVVLYIAGEGEKDREEEKTMIEKLMKIYYNRVIILVKDYELSLATSAVEKGAFDVLDAEDIPSIVNAIQTALDAQEIKRGFIDISGIPPSAFEREEEFIIGRSRAMINVFKAIGFVAKSDVPVLITGETGVGKELVARMIHKKSLFKDGPFVPVNCSAIPETLLESELFGYVKGAFTGAVSDKEGKIESAEGGTLFLDEIGEIPPSIQVKLLRVLQEKIFERLGENKPRKVNTRIIAATNKNLPEEISRGRFREDLFFRLNLATIYVPPLRERKEDIPLLVYHFFIKSQKEMHKKVKGITAKAIEKLMRYDWPGNVRELQNVVMRSVLIARGNYVMAEDIILDPTYKITEHDSTKLKTLKEVEKDYIERVLKYTRGNKTLTAKLLGISRPSLLAKIKKYGIME